MKKNMLKYISLVMVLIITALSLASCSGFDTILGYEGTDNKSDIPTTGDNITNNITSKLQTTDVKEAIKKEEAYTKALKTNDATKII